MKMKKLSLKEFLGLEDQAVKLNSRNLNRILREEIAVVLSEERKPQPKRHSLKNVRGLYEQEDVAAAVTDIQEEPVDNKVLLVLYGPPAAGKGAAKKLATDLAGKELKDGEKNFKDFLKGMAKSDDPEVQDRANMFFQEEDSRMTSATTGELPPLVFAELHKAAGGTDSEAGTDQGAFESAVAEHFNVNETGVRRELSDILSWNTYQNLMNENPNDPAGAAQQFTTFPETQSWFAQARGWSKPVEGFSLNDWTGETDDEATLGFRYMASEKFMEDVESDLEGFLSQQDATETAANIYLADQAGESSANLDRIADFGALKEKYPNIKVVGAYIYQPADRTKIANLHRASFDKGGRRVAQAEVDRIYDNAPEVDVDGKSVDVTEEGPAISAMQDAGFDSVYVFAPPNAFDPEEETAADGRNVGAAICQPFGDGTGYFSIEGCEEYAEGGSEADAMQYAGMEKKATKRAGIETEDGFMPKEPDDNEKQQLVGALNDMGFGIQDAQLLKYIKDYAPPGADRAGEEAFGINTWSKKLFADETNPTAQSADLATTKKESARSSKESETLILERWRKLAGLL
tara:strand:+ start:330 stop:2054 length:1725 start_codon:yes stop_codon:yes gene_type:complete